LGGFFWKFEGITEGFFWKFEGITEGFFWKFEGITEGFFWKFEGITRVAKTTFVFTAYFLARGTLPLGFMLDKSTVTFFMPWSS
jgi:hypothetical protein